ncbi:MAG: hypothetical protein IPM29_06530 [Planctomycetes bacterium]|nr:hypothetical protein [Planctomycetota bacterium]
MGFLDWLRRGRGRIGRNDWVWLTEPEKLAGLAREAHARLAAGESVLLVAHFRDTLVRAATAVAGSGVALQARPTWTARDTADLLRPGAAFATLASALPEPDGAAAGTAPSGNPVAVLAAELHALRAANDRMAAFVRTLPQGSSLRAFLALDEPLMRPFANDRVRNLMQTLGLKHGDRIDSGMVTSGIRRALAKLEQGAIGDGPAETAQEWYDRYHRH